MSRALPLTVLTYESAATPSPRRSRLVRLGGGCALLALALTLLFAPLCLLGGAGLGAASFPPASGFAQAILQDVPLVQAILLGVGLLLTAIGMVRTGADHYPAYLLALTLNGVATAGLWLEMARVFPA